MKYMHKFKTFENRNTIDINRINEYTEEYISKLTKEEIEQLKIEIEKFAIANNCSIDDLSNPDFVKDLLYSNIEEGIGTWIKNNWYKLCNYIGIGGKIAGIITFVGSILVYQTYGIDTMDGVKIGVAAYVISNIVQSLKLLEILKEK
jgi:hypothetical protein